MSRNLVFVLLGGLIGYVVGVDLGTWFAERLLAGTPGGDLRAASVGVFVLGPLMAVVGAVAGAILASRR